MSFIAAVLILNLEEAEAFITFANLLNKPCQMAFFRVDHELVKIYRLYLFTPPPPLPLLCPSSSSSSSCLLFFIGFSCHFPQLCHPSSLLPSLPDLQFSSSFRCWSILKPLRFSSRRIFLSSSVTSRATTWRLIFIWLIGERSTNLISPGFICKIPLAESYLLIVVQISALVYKLINVIDG